MCFKRNILGFVLLFYINIFSQVTFDFAFNHLKQDSTSTLVKFQLIDFDFDGNDDLASVYRNSSSWSFNVNTKNHSLIYNYTNQNNGLILKNTLLFRKNNSWFLSAIFTKSDGEFKEKEILCFKIIDLSTQQIVDSVSLAPGRSSGDFWEYKYLKIYLNEIDDSFYFNIGMTLDYWGHGPGVDYDGSVSYLKKIVYKDSLELSTVYFNYKALIQNGMIIYGGNSYSSTYSNSFDFRINSFLIDSLSGDFIMSDAFEYDESMRYYLLSSDDISNNKYGISFLAKTYPDKTFFTFDPQNSSILWESVETNFYNYSYLRFSSNISINKDNSYLICINNYNEYEIRSRTTGIIIANGIIPFYPTGIISDSNLNRYILSFGGRTYTFYKINSDNLVSVEENNVPTKFELFQNFPNPFNPSTVIQYTIPTETSLQKVTLKVYDVLGKEIATLIDKYQSFGNYNVEFNASVIEEKLSSGVYFYRLQIGNLAQSSNSFIKTKKMVLIK